MGSNIALRSFLIPLTLVFLFNNISLAKHENSPPSAFVVGTVYCDTCFQKDFSKNSHFISGASVLVECRDKGSKLSFKKEVKTNGHGEFKVALPSGIGKHVKRIKQCSVKLVSSSEPFCAVASSATSSSLRLKSKKEGTHIFSAGFFTFKPLKQPEMCTVKPNFANSKDLYNKDFFPYPDRPTFPTLPPLTQTPLLPINLPTLPPIPQIPQIPQIPNLSPLPNLGNQPGAPIQPKTGEFKKGGSVLDNKVVRPTFFFSPPSIPLLPSPPPAFGIPMPPNPFQPPPLVPNPFQPPPPTIGIPPFLPPIPLLTPPPPPPRFPFPFPFPPYPPLFPAPSPGFPGIPPASKKTSP
ncbi:hypothetical protein Syun_012489 [Stephania yunnanensis]|uniref:Uncharacterized protein n=1 Tax=Stephania yunnanensis TaxID=152371 RepID=A0AAP0K0A4_9MAGN